MALLTDCGEWPRWIRGQVLTRDDALELMRQISRALGIHLVELRSIADEPMRETDPGDGVIVWNPCDGARIGEIASDGEFVGPDGPWTERAQGPAFTHWGVVTAPPNDDAVLYDLRRHFKERTGRAPWER